MPDYKAAFEAASLDLSTIMSALGFVSYPGIDPMLRAITNLTLAKAEAQALREEVATLREAHDKEWRRAGMAEENLKALLSARVVVPDEEESFERWAVIHNLDLTVPPSPGDYESTVTLMAWDAWKERSRLNGKAVSEGLLRRVVNVESDDFMLAINELSDLLGEGKEVGDA